MTGASVFSVIRRVIETFGFVCAGAACAIMVGACGLMGENASGALVAPGKYDYYSCEQLSTSARILNDRERELSELTARAAQGPGGEFVGAVAYKTELIQARGELKQIAGLVVLRAPPREIRVLEEEFG